MNRRYLTAREKVSEQTSKPSAALRSLTTKLLAIIDTLSTTFSWVPLGPVEIRAPLIPPDRPISDFDKLIRKGPNLILLRKKETH